VISGKIIAVVGVDGVGKSTLARALHAELERRGEPCDLFQRDKHALDRMTLANKYMLETENPWLDEPQAGVLAAATLLDFLESYSRRILPAYEAGRTIVCDRYFPCFFAYCRATKAGTHFERMLSGVIPATVVLELVAQPEALKRRQLGRGGIAVDEDALLQQRFLKGYEAYRRSCASRWHQVEADVSPDEVRSRCLALLDQTMSSGR